MKSAVNTLIGIFAALTVITAVAKIANMLWPINTVIAVAIGTIGSCVFQKKTALMSLSGLALYAISWPLAYLHGEILGSTVCCTGIVLWFIALIKMFNPENTLRRMPVS